MMLKNMYQIINLYYISISVLLLDQVSKQLITNIRIMNGKIIVPGIARIHLVHNSGAAFSILENFPKLLALTSIIASIVLIIIIALQKKKNQISWQYYSFLLGGCLGNGIDRIRLTYVTDFIELIPINFPIFNIADISINIAVVLILIEIIKNHYKLDFNR